MRQIHLLPVVLLALLMSACGLTDIRPDEFRRLPTEAEIDQGKALLKKMEQAHGIESYLGYESLHAEIDDDWSQAFFVAKLLGPFPDEKLHYSIDADTRTKDGRFTFRDGELKGEMWSFESGTGYIYGTDGSREEGNALTIAGLVDPNCFFFQAPFHFSTGKVIYSLGKEEVKGVMYERVFVTWAESAAPAEDEDQYIVWMRADTHHLAFLQLTSRASKRVANIEFLDEREVSGTTLPHQVTMVKSVGGPIKVYRLKARSIELSTEVYAVPDERAVGAASQPAG